MQTKLLNKCKDNFLAFLYKVLTFINYLCYYNNGDNMSHRNISDLLKILVGKYKDNERFLSSLTANGELAKKELNIYHFRHSYESYQNILEIYSDLVREFRLQNSLEIAILFTYLLWNGYFSAKGSHMYTNNRIASIEGLESFDVMNGKGACLGYSTMLRDFLITCGYDSANLLNIQDDNIKLTYTPKINRTQGKLKKITKFDEFVSKTITQYAGNHVFTLIIENGQLYAYDPTNLALISIENINEAKIVNGKGKFKLKPYTSYIANLSKKSVSVLEKLHQGKNFKNPYTLYRFREIVKSLIQYLDENVDIIGEFYNMAYEDICYVASTATDAAKKR